MRPSPTLVFVVCALGLASAVGIFASRREHVDDDAPSLPSDAARFGFVVRASHDVPLLEATKPFRLDLANGPVHGEPPTKEHFTSGAAIVARELERYPASFLRRARLAGVVLGESLGENDTPIPSLPNVGGLLLIDVSSAEGDLVRAFHHEIFHFFDLADDGNVAPDPTWSALDPPGFVYGSGGRTMREPWAARPTADLPGFVNAYATSGVEEDKAETFAFAVARAPLMHACVARDAVLRAKLVELVQRVGAFDAACPNALGLDDYR